MGSKGIGVRSCSHVFQKLLCSWPHRFFFTLAWPWWQSMWHAVGHHRGQQDKHMAFGIIEREICLSACVCVYHLKSPSRLVTGYRWLARWHGILLSEQEPAICLRSCEKLFSLLGEHMSVPKVAATLVDSFTLLLSAFALFIRRHLGRWLCKIKGRSNVLFFPIFINLADRYGIKKVLK